MLIIELTISEVVGYLDLPLDEALARVEGQHDRDVLADDGDRVGLLVEGEAALRAQKVLQAERRLGLALLVAVLAVGVQLQVQAVCKQSLRFFISIRA